MKKIGIITLNDYFNYGNRLQNIALVYFFKSINNKEFFINSIWYNNKDIKINRKYINFRNIKRYIFNKHDFKHYIDSGILFKEIIREYNIKKFSDKYSNEKKISEIRNNINQEYDFFIVGSDQVWKPNGINKFSFLQFADRNKRIAYAASFGVTEIKPEKIKIVQDGLNGIDFISVREKAGAKIVKELTGRDVPVLVDPTLLLTADEWEKIMERPVWYKDEKYILVYFLSKLPTKVKNDIKNLAEKFSLKIIDLMDKENIDYYCSDPSEFLFLVKNCTLMYTDSFHGTVFSIIFRKPFVTCSRENTTMNMDSRIDTLFDLFGFFDRKISKENNYEIKNPMEIKYPDVDAILDRERQRSKAFLCKALNIKE